MAIGLIKGIGVGSAAKGVAILGASKLAYGQGANLLAFDKWRRAKGGVGGFGLNKFHNGIKEMSVMANSFK